MQTHNLWTPEEDAVAMDYGLTTVEVAARINRSPKAVESRRGYLTVKSRRDSADAEREADIAAVHRALALQQAIERANRYTNAPYRSLGGMLLGDPPIGYSALDSRVGAPSS